MPNVIFDFYYISIAFGFVFAEWNDARLISFPIASLFGRVHMSSGQQNGHVIEKYPATTGKSSAANDSSAQSSSE